MSNIPQEAIEKAALALDKFWGGRYAPDAVEELSDEMRVVLEAAFPVLAAPVLNAAEHDLARHPGALLGTNDVLAWLRTRAAEYREGKPTPAAPPVSCRCEFGWQPECPHHGTEAAR